MYKNLRRSLPKFSSIIWLLMCFKMIYSDAANSRDVIDYLIWGISCGYTAWKVFSNKIGRDVIRIMISSSILIMLMVIGLLQINTSHSFTAIIAVVCIICFLISNSFFLDSIQPLFIEIGSCAVILKYFIYTYKGINLGNTIPGIICFVICMFAITIALDQYMKDKKNPSLIGVISIIVLYTVSLYITWKSGSRTSTFTLLIIVMQFVFFELFFKNKRIYSAMFWIIIMGIFLGTVLYINIHSFSWYNTINDYSIDVFGKNLDSSRPYLWGSSLKSLKWWQWLLGAGTGKLPAIERYSESSFHNSYIQLLMQNGLVGLSCLIYILWCLWRDISKAADYPIVRFVLACYVGILIYNCFECTLLQNKAFLGLFEWMIIGIGVNCARQCLKEAENV